MAWLPIESAPRDGTDVLLWCDGRLKKGSWRVDSGFSGNEEPLWLADDYDDFSTGYASTPLNPTHWMPMPEAPQ